MLNQPVLRSSVIAVLGTFSFFAKSLILDCQLGIETLLCRKIHNDQEPVYLELGYWNIFKIKLIYLLRYLLRDPLRFESWRQAICRDMLSRLSSQNLQAEQLEFQVPKYHIDAIDQETFFKEFLRKGNPVILQGIESEAFQTWSKAYFLENYGNAKTRVCDVNTVENYETLIHDYLSNDDPEQMSYLRNSIDMMKDHPELEKQVNPQRFEAYMSGQRSLFSHYAMSDLFIGVTHKTSTGFHCANANNLFFMIDGRKQWTFVHPDYTWLLEPIFNTAMLFMGSDLVPGVMAIPEAMEKLYPLWQYCPKSIAILEPGDVLLSPTWYWHMVDNLTDFTIAVATRWFPANRPTNRFASLLQVLSPTCWMTVWRVLRGELALEPDDKGNASTGVAEIDHAIAFGQLGGAQRVIEHKQSVAQEYLSAVAYEQYRKVQAV